VLQIRSEYVSELAAKLAALKQLTKTDAVKLALENELRRIEEEKPLQDRVASWPETRLPADKAFYDDLSGPRA